LSSIKAGTGRGLVPSDTPHGESPSDAITSGSRTRRTERSRSRQEETEHRPDDGLASQATGLVEGAGSVRRHRNRRRPGAIGRSRWRIPRGRTFRRGPSSEPLARSRRRERVWVTREPRSEDRPEGSAVIARIGCCHGANDVAVGGGWVWAADVGKVVISRFGAGLARPTYGARRDSGRRRSPLARLVRSLPPSGVGSLMKTRAQTRRCRADFIWTSVGYPPTMVQRQAPGTSGVCFDAATSPRRPRSRVVRRLDHLATIRSRRVGANRTG
jgi:hypothetical protein